MGASLVDKTSLPCGTSAMHAGAKHDRALHSLTNARDAAETDEL